MQLLAFLYNSLTLLKERMVKLFPPFTRMSNLLFVVKERSQQKFFISCSKKEFRKLQTVIRAA